MNRTLPELRPITLSGPEAAVLGLIASGCRLLFAGPAAQGGAADAISQVAAWMERAGGTLVAVQSEADAALMAAGAAMGGARAAALVAGEGPPLASLTGLDDLTPVLVEVSGRLPLVGGPARAVLAPHTPQSAYETGLGAFGQARALHGPVLIAGLEMEPDDLRPELPEEGESWDASLPPIHHTGPDDPDLLILGAGPGFAACAEAREELEARGHAAAHLHLLQILPFPGAIIAPALTSARRVLVVEPGGPGTLAGLVRSQLGAPTAPFGELPRLGATPISAAQVADRAQEVMLL